MATRQRELIYAISTLIGHALEVEREITTSEEVDLCRIYKTLKAMGDAPFHETLKTVGDAPSPSDDGTNDPEPQRVTVTYYEDEIEKILGLQSGELVRSNFGLNLDLDCRWYEEHGVDLSDEAAVRQAYAKEPRFQEGCPRYVDALVHAAAWSANIPY